MKHEILVKRVYEPAGPGDGTRMLVDRLWPRGLKKEQVQAQWLKDAAPSNALRTWFHHDVANWEEFKSRYFVELDAQGPAVAQLLEAAEKGSLTLLYGARDTQYNQAVALREYLLRKQTG